MIELGKKVDHFGSLNLDLERLVETRLLVQANSGGGKSWLLRKLLEETHGKVQHIVLDIEGEFVTLREKYDYLVVGKEGDIPVSIRTAELLAKKILELGVSSIIDLYELKQHERILFVKRFLDALIDSDKSLWHPCLVVIDEVHQFCPQTGSSESSSSVIDLATRGRKRGYCAIMATQRLSKLHKDAAAECNNKLIGRTGLDVDMKRAGEELGFTSKEDIRSLRDLEPGEFCAFGPALSKSVVKVRIGKVKTTHPKVGSRLVGLVTPARGKILEALSKLKDLPAEQEKILKTKEDFEKEIRSLRGQLVAAKSSHKVVPTPSAADMERAQRVGFEKAAAQYKTEVEKQHKEVMLLRKYLQEIYSISGRTLERELPAETVIKTPTTEIKLPLVPTIKTRSALVYKRTPREVENDFSSSNIPGGALKILQALAQFNPTELTKQQVGIIAGYSSSSGSFATFLSILKTRGAITISGSKLGITEEGISLVGNFEPLPTDKESILRMWRSKFSGGAAKIFDVIAENYPNELTKEQIGEATGYSHLSGSFSTFLSTLRTSGVIETTGQVVRPTRWLLLEGLV